MPGDPDVRASEGCVIRPSVAFSQNILRALRFILFISHNQVLRNAVTSGAVAALEDLPEEIDS